MLAGQFAEPNNRWLMPFLHVHSRVLNFTSFRENPGRLECIEAASLAREGQKAKQDWTARQAGLLADLGYRADVGRGPHAVLRVEGVCPRLVAAIEAPRIAVLRMLERALAGDRRPSAERLSEELPPVVIAALSEQIESLLARSLSWFKPRKVEIPSEGPWRGAVREHLSHYCPGSLEQLDKCARRAKADIFESPVFPSPQLDRAHCHAPCAESLEAAHQMPCDAELGATPPGARIEAGGSERLAREFDATLREVNERIVSVGPEDPLVSLRRLLATIDHVPAGADQEQLRQSGALLEVELERRESHGADEPARERRPGIGHRVPLASLDDLFAEASIPRPECEQEIGGRSL
jgi:hypothetical protein